MTKAKNKKKMKRKKEQIRGRNIQGSEVIDLGIEDMKTWGTDQNLSSKEPQTSAKRKGEHGKLDVHVKKSKLDRIDERNAKEYEEKQEFKTAIDEMKEGGLPDMSAWKNLLVPDCVLRSLAEDGFVTPTPIQALALPSAIRDRMDIIGAAQTGSGKTLAFGIPLLHNIIQFKETKSKEEEEADSDDSDVSSYSEDSDQSATDDESHSNDSESEKNGEESDTGTADHKDSSEALVVDSDEDIHDNESDDDSSQEAVMESDVEDSSEAEPEDEEESSLKSQLFQGQAVEELEIPFGVEFGGGLKGEVQSDEECDLSPGEDDDEIPELQEGDLGCVRAINNVVFDWLKKPKQLKLKSQRQHPLLALVLCPTRELAIQVTRHIEKAARYTDIKICTIVGGMSSQKQERVLKKCPEIVVATPGRLWELIQQGEPHLCKAEFVRYLVIDEADRMVEKGHFQELTQLLELINSDEDQRKKRQTFVFSATLTFVHSGPDRFIFKKKKKFKKLDEKQKLDSLMQIVGLKDRPKVIDLSRKEGTADTLVESRIVCSKVDKDLYLYYFTQQYPGRTLVFANSKDCLRRLVSLFTLLQCRPLPLHADMHQRQRLKNLDRFKADSRGLLLATDVAARGLDIPDVQHVIHYQVPRTTENYIHRSGRTARASKEGLSVMLVSPDDSTNFKKIIRTLNRDEDLPIFPVEYDYIKGIKERVILATNIDKQEHFGETALPEDPIRRHMEYFRTLCIDGTLLTNRHLDVPHLMPSDPIFGIGYYSQLKLKRQNSWFEKAAKEVEIELDEKQLLHDIGDTVEQQQQRHGFKQMKQQLQSLLKQPVVGRHFSGRYPTKSGKLVMPCDIDLGQSTATNVLKLDTEKVKERREKQTVTPSPVNKDSQARKLKKKQRYLRMKRFATAKNINSRKN